MAYAEDEALRVLRGGGEDKTILPDGSFSAGARMLSDTDISSVQHCLVDPGSGRRVRVVQRVARSAGAAWATVGVEVWVEERKQCVAPFSASPRADLADDSEVRPGGYWILLAVSSN